MKLEKESDKFLNGSFRWKTIFSQSANVTGKQIHMK